MARGFDFLEQAFLPLMRRMGYDVHAYLARRGFNPAGDGEIQLSIGPREAARALVLTEAGKRLRHEAHAIVANLPYDIAED
jgi:RNA 3'-terminal phosphate cyclase (ATP)